MLQSQNECGKILVKDGYIVCPVCRRPTSQRILPDTRAKNLRVWCRKCKHVTVVDIESGQCSRSPC